MKRIFFIVLILALATTACVKRDLARTDMPTPPTTWDGLKSRGMPAGFADDIDDGAGSASISDVAHPTGWDADTVNGATRNAIFDALALKVDTSALTTHNTSDDHDGRYYTETQVNSLLGLRVAVGVDPDADRIYFWDDSGGTPAFLTVGTGLDITGGTLTATGGAGHDEVTIASGITGLSLSGQELTLHASVEDLAEFSNPGADRIWFWDNSAGVFTGLTIGTNLSITGTTLSASLTGGSVDTSGTPAQYDIARFIDADTIEGLTYAELGAIAGFESAMEGVLDLQDLQGAVIDGQVPNDITINLATLATNITLSANNTTDETVYLVFADGATGTQGGETDIGLTYNPNTGIIGAAGFESSASDGAKFMHAINTVAITSSATAGRLAYYNGFYYLADGTDWNNYLIDKESIDSESEFESLLGFSITVPGEIDTWAELPAAIDSYIIVGNGSNQPAAVAMSGDVAISNNGTTTVSGVQSNAGDLSLTSGQVGIDTTQAQFAYHDGTREVVLPSIRVAHGRWDLSSYYDYTHYVRMVDLDTERYPDGIVITQWELACETSADPTTELNANLYYSDDPGAGILPGATPTLVDVIDSTTGNASESTMSNSDLGSGAIPAGSTLYILLDADPTDASTMWSLKVHYYIPES